MAYIGEMQYLTIGNNTYSLPTGGEGSITTEVDPIFSASPAAEITAADITNWNSKTSNTGTVTSITLTQGTGISIGSSGTAITTTGSRTISLATITKSDTTSTASPAHGGTFTAVDSITYDTYGRVTGVNTKTITLPADSNTHNTAYLYAGTSTGSANAATTNGNTYLILVDGGTATTRRKISGATNVSVTSDSSGNITITGPNLSGYALSSAIPTQTSQLTNDSGFITDADIPEGASAYTGTISAVSTSAATGSSNAFARGDHVHNITSNTITSALGFTPVSTDKKLEVAQIGSGTTNYIIMGSGTSAATRQYDTTGLAYERTTGVVGSESQEQYARLILGNSTSYTTSGGARGAIRLYGTRTNYTDLVSGTPTAARTLTLPDASGTIALTSDIPTETTVSGWGFTKNIGTLTGVTFAGTSMSISSGVASITQANARTALGLATVATSGSYNDLTNKPTIPTNTSDLTNDSGFITSYIDTKNTAGSTNSTSKLYLIGATSQATNPQTYSNSGLYFDNGINSETSATSGWQSYISQDSGSILLGISNNSDEYNISIDWNEGITIDGVVTPTENSHAANKKYVDDSINTISIPTKTSDLTNDSGFITSYTDEKLKWTASTSTDTFYPLQSNSSATTSTANTLNGISVYQYYNIAGGYRRLNLGNSTAYKSTGGAYGTIRLYGSAATYYGDLVPGVLGTTSGDGHISANRTWTLPDATGTIALTSDIVQVQIVRW